MNERSIILYAHEIRRLLDAGEVQIWRPIKPQPYYEPGAIGELQKRNGVITHVCGAVSMEELAKRCPHQPGERRWVKEKFQVYDVCYDDWTGGYEAGYVLSVIPKEKPAYRVGISYAADGGLDGSWRSAVHMPRWASRLTVEILNVEARQVQSVTEDEAREAGIRLQGCLARDKFAHDWTRRYAKHGLGWEKNPGAWVIKLARKAATEVDVEKQERGRGGRHENPRQRRLSIPGDPGRSAG